MKFKKLALVGILASALLIGAWMDFSSAQITPGTVAASFVKWTRSTTGAISRSLSSILADKISVKDFGAVGDGVHDDTTAIQSAIDYALSRPSFGGSIVYFPAGLYKTTSTLTITNGSVKLVGEFYIGATNFSPKQWGGTTIYYTANDGNDVIYINKASGTMYAVEISNLRVTATTSGGSKSTGIHVKNASEFLFDNLYVGGMSIGIGIRLEEVTLLYGNKLYISACDTAMQLETYGGTFNTNDGIRLRWCNFWQNYTGFKILGNSEILLRDSWMERFAYGVDIAPPATKNCNVQLNFDSAEFSTDNYYIAQSRGIKSLAPTTASYFLVSTNLSFKDCKMTTSTGDYCMELDKGGNSNGNTYYKVMVDGGSYQSQVASIWSNMMTAPSVRGNVRHTNSSSVQVPLYAGSGYWNIFTSEYGRWDLGADGAILTTDITYYVRTDGSDSNSGLSNSASGAFLTIQAAVNAASKIDARGHAVTVKVGDGTYAAGATISKVPLNASRFYITGNTTTPGNCIISSGTSRAFYFTSAPSGWTQVKGFNLTNTSSSLPLMEVIGSIVEIQDLEFGSSDYYAMQIQNNGKVVATGNFKVLGNVDGLVNSTQRGQFECSSRTITVGSSVTAFAGYFVRAADADVLFLANTLVGEITGGTPTAGQVYRIGSADGGADFTPSGAADNNVGTEFTADGDAPTWGTGGANLIKVPTGIRFIASRNGVVYTNAAAVNYLLGLTAGVTETGGFCDVGTGYGPVTAFGEIYLEDGVTAQNIPTGAAYTKLTSFATDGSSSNCTVSASNDKITITKTGKYLVSFNISLTSDTSNVVYRVAPFYDAVEQGQVHDADKFLVGSDLASMSSSGIVNVTTANLDLDLRIRHDNVGTVAITPVYANLHVERIGD